ncbi:hypothetical protein LUZ60_010613 [Juncus effusus]|nr:hypothetical protein LUZ60_010613 [Juncus effusus]
MAIVEFLLAMASLFLPILCLTVNTSLALTELTATQSLKDSQVLLSSNEMFALGFFSPGRNTNRYLGIWYKSTNQTIVWVANRDSPITDSTGVLTLGANGALHLKDSTGEEHWFTNSQAVKTPKAFLLDSGNLVVTDTSSNTQLWQSFDQPCDTLLPGMKMGYDSAFGHESYLQSWKGENDPTPGDYIHKLDLTRCNELIILKGTNLIYRSGPWNGIRWNGMPEMQEKSFLKFNLISNQYQLLYWYETNNTTNLWRLVMGSDGIVYRTHNSRNIWKPYWHVPNNPCDNYGFCGPNGICSNNDCKCLFGFEPKIKSEWEVRIFSDGCMRTDSFEYTDRNGFLKLRHVKLPDTLHATVYSEKNLNDCEKLCLSNSSCMGLTVIGFSGCLIWVSDLIDMVEFTDQGGDDFYIRVTDSGVQMIIIAIRRRSKSHNFTSQTTPSINAKEDVRAFEFSTLREATSDFSELNKLGEGQFGPVYKGVLENGEEIAVKRLSRSSNQGIEQLRNEVNFLARLRHINLVKLLGFCIQKEEMLLCYEYLPHGSLDQILFGNESNTYSQLEWGERYKIIEAISYGLLYLHEENGRTIIHRDIKPSNILLDKNMIPKISDFGLAKLFDEDGSFIKVSTVAGTRGYIAPEMQNGMLSTKSDVYSFGVLILETITGQKNISFPSGLVSHVLQFWNEGRVLEIADQRLRDTCPLEEIKRCTNIALLCLLEVPEKRPKIRDINLMLLSKSSVIPALPIFNSHWGLRNFGTSESD